MNKIFNPKNIRLCKTTNILLCIMGIVVLIVGCNKKPENTPSIRRAFADQSFLVSVTPVVKGTFYRELFNNGTLHASQKAVMQFKQQGEINYLSIANGQRVAKGQVMVAIDNFRQLNDHEKAVRAVEKARYNLEDALISAGFSLADSAEVPLLIMRSCLIKSGYSSALADLQMAARNLAETSLKAPFDGVVADCELRLYNPSGQFKQACTVINDRELKVQFPVLESEYGYISKGLPVQIVPFALINDTFPGTIYSVNPSVSDNGMINVTAKIENRGSKLIDGMNVQVLVRIPMPQKLVLPKEAVVLRQERKVVFTVKNDTAYWNYVKVGEENSRFVTIENGLTEGDKVIVSGQLNLAHLTAVKVAN